MKSNYKYLLLAGLFAAGMSACVDDNDWSTDSSHNRLFSAQDIQVSPQATTAEVTFDRLPSVDYYILELNTDSLYLEDYHAGSRIDTVTASPYTLEGLSGETVYFLRLRSCSRTGIQSSVWSYYIDGDLRSFETNGEQIFNSVTTADLTESTVHLTWLEGAAVTHIVVSTDDGTTVKTVQLTNTDIASSACTVDGLSPQTKYHFIIYNNEVKRGEIDATTTAEMPAADLKYSLTESVTLIDQALIDNLATLAQAAAEDPSNYSLTIGIPGGCNIALYGIDPQTNEATSLSIPEGMSVTFFALPGEQPALSFPKSLEIGGTHDYIRFDGLNIVDDGCQYLINQSKATNVNEFTLSNCVITDMNRSIVRLQGSDSKTIQEINLENCVITNIGAGGYAVFRTDNAAYTIASINITNSTFNNVNHNFVQAGGCNLGEINLTGCTFYNTPNNSSRYLIDANGNNTNVNVQNTIFGLTGGRGIRTSGTTTVVNSYKTTDGVFTSNDFAVDLTSPELSSTDLFTDPANGDFTLLNRALQGIGDPRWY